MTETGVETYCDRYRAKGREMKMQRDRPKEKGQIE